MRKFLSLCQRRIKEILGQKLLLDISYQDQRLNTPALAWADENDFIRVFWLTEASIGCWEALLPAIVRNSFVAI